MVLINHVGDKLNDEPHGKGKGTYSDGATYDGDWHEGVQ
jgi:hypothetical protein